MNNQKFIIISGPSGVGKTTIINKLLDKHADKLERLVTYTTGEPRHEEHEIKGEYNFITVDDFQKLIDEGSLIEYDSVYGNYYGKSFNDLESIWADKKTAIGTIDPLSIDKEEFNKDYIIKIFLTVDDAKILRNRLEKRHLPKERIEKRMAQIPAEQNMAKYADFVVENKENQLDDTVFECEKIIFETP